MITPHEAAVAAPRTTRAEIVGRLAAVLADEHFGTGPLAELRRLDPAGPLSQPALHRLLARYVPEQWVGRESLRLWALVIHGLALAAPDHLFGEKGLGEALLRADFKERRFVNLLEATPDELLYRLPRAVRFLVKKGWKLHGPQLADLVLVRQEREPKRHVDLRQGIAADYYRAEFKAAPPAAAAP